MLNKQDLDTIACTVFQSFEVQRSRLGLSDKTTGDLLGTSRITYRNWRTGKTMPDNFASILLMLDLTPRLAAINDAQGHSLRRKDDAADRIRMFFV